MIPGDTEQPSLINTTQEPPNPSNPPEPPTELIEPAASSSTPDLTGSEQQVPTPDVAPTQGHFITEVDSDIEGVTLRSMADPSPLGFTTAAAPTVPSPAPLQQQPNNPLEIVIGTAGKLINIAAGAIGMLFSPIFNPNYNGPGGLALVFATLDMVRRELDRAFSNSSPTAVADLATTSELLPTTIAVLANDIDPNLGQGDILTVVGYTQAGNGTVALNSDGSFTYTPNAGFSGVDTFTYTISDDASPWHIHGLAGLFGRGGHASTAAVTITVGEASVNVAPVAGPDSATVTQGSGPTTINVLGNDNDADNDPLTITGVTQPDNGTVTFTTTGVSYTPDETFAGTDTFTYTVSDGTTTTIGTVTVTVTPVIVVNTPPTAVDDHVSTAEDTAVAIDVIANDSDPEGDSLHLTAISSAGHGIVVINGNTVTYTPSPDWNGTDTFTYTITDGEHEATATVSVVVTPVNESPVANDDSVTLPQGSGSTFINVLANDTDADNAPTPLQVTGVTQPANGTVVPSSTGLSYTPNTGFSGTDTFTYTITDGTSFDSATVTVTVTPVNQPPQLVIGDVEVDDDGVVTGLITVTDPDGPTLTVTPPVIDEGDVTVTNLGGGVFGFTFTPTQEAHETAWATIGDDAVSLTFTVSDGVAAAVSASVLAPITPAEPTTDPGGYEAIDLADLDSLTGITVTVGGQVYVIGKGALDFDDDGGSDYTGYILGTVDTADQTFTPVVLLRDSVQPFDIAVGPNGRIFVADVATGVTAYDPANGYLPTTVLAGPAVQVAFGNDKLYVTAFDFNPETATSSGRLYIFDSDLTQVGAPIALEDPSFGLAIGPTGYLYLTSLDFSANPTQPTDGKLTVLNGDGELVVRIATTGVAPYGVTVDGDGIAYVTDPLNSTIYAVDPFGRGIIGTVEAPAGSLALDIGPDGLLYVPSQISRSIVVLDPSDVITEPGGGQELNADIDVFAENIGTLAIGLALDGNGGLYVTDLGLRISEAGEQLPGNGAIIYLGPDGIPVGDPVSLNGNPWGVAVGNGGLLYVSDYASGTIWVIDAAAQSVDTFVSIPGQGATLATDDAGNVYVIGFEAPSEFEEFSTFTLHIFDAAGSETGTLPASGPAFAVTPDGKIYIPISDGSGSSIYTEIRVLNGDGTEAAPAISLGAFSPASMAFGADGTLYIAGFDAANTGGPSTQAELIVIDPRGTMTAPVSLGSVIPWSLVVDGDSAIYFSDSTTGTIYRVTLSGLPADTNSAPEVGDPAFDVTGIGALGSVRGHVNVEDPDGDPLSYTLTPGSADTAVGTVSVDVHGNWIFTPTAQARVDAASTEGEDNTTFSLTVSDGLETIVVPITVTIRPNVAAPVAQSPAYTINNVDKYTGVVTGVVHVIDLDDPVLLYTVTTNGNGAVTVQDDGSFTYTPNSKARQLASLTPGEDAATFTITATDGFHAPATITVEAAITPATDFALSALYGGEQESWGNQSVAVGTDGRIYFTTYLADDTVGEVVVLNADGTYATTVSIADVVGYPFASAYDVVVGDDGRVFVSSEVADTLEDLSAEAGRGVIVVIDPDNDYATSQFAELADPAGALAVDSTGRLYVANWNNDNITVLNVDGSVHRVIQSEPLFEGDDSGVAGLAISGSGLLYLTKPGLGAIKVVNQNGTTADVFEVGGAPWAIAVNAVGHLFVSDFGSSSVVELDQAGAVVRSIALAQDVQASDVTVAEDGTVYVPYLGSNGASIAIITAVSGLPDGGIQHGPEITGTPVMVSTSTLAVGNAVYQSTVSTGSGTGLVTTTLTLVRADGSSTSVQGTGETYGDITAGPNGVVYQTLTYTDPASGDRQSGVLVIASDGTGYFTGLRSGIPIGPVVSGDNATYQIIYRHDEQNSAYTTTVLAIVDGVVFDHEVSGIPGGPISGASNAVVAPDGTVYLTVTDIPSDSLDYSGATTSVVILSADGLTSHTTAGFAGGPVTIASDGTVYQSLGIAHLDSETGDTTFTAAVAVLEGTGLVARPETVTGIPIGGIVVRPDGSALLTVVILDDSEGSESGASSTLLVEVTENGLTALIEPVAGTPIALDGSWLPAVVDSDGVAYLTTSASNSESDSTTTTVTVLQRDGAIELWTMSGQPVGGVVPGSAGTVYQTTYDSTTDITRIAAITASGRDTHMLAGYPGNSDTVGKPSGPVVGPDGNAYLTVSSKNSATGGYSTTVAVVSSNGVASWSFNGLPSSSVVFDSNGVAHQATYEFDFARQIHVTTVFTVTPNGTSQVGEALLGHPNGSVVFGSDGAVYVSVSQQGGAGTTTVHALIAPASDQPLVQRNTTTSEPGRSPAFSLASNSTNPYIRVIDTAYLRPFITADPTGRFFYTSYIKSLRGLTNDVTPISESYAKQLADVMQQQYGSHGFASDSQGRLVYRNTYSQDVLVVFGPRSDNLAPVGAILVRAGTTETLPASEDGRFAASQRIGQQGWDAFVYRGATPVQETKPKSSTKSTQPTYSTTTEALAKRIKELYLTKNAGSDSIRVDRVSSSDGTNRLVVYITGIEFTIESIQNAWDVRVNGYKSSAVQKILQAYNEVPYRTPSETMLVGHSKGGMIAQLIAQDSRWREYFNVTAVVTFGSPRVTPLIHVSGLNYQSIHLESQWDVVSGGALDTWTLISLNTKTYSSAANNNCGINLGCYHSMETYIKIGQEFDKKYTYAELGYFQGTKIKSYPSHKYA
ncbi:hypothetical protein C1S81_11560 [Mycolicibacterium neoaurum]|nr:hypothetical protein C1S81_11560 [Mycolicibacterium neoaurum]